MNERLSVAKAQSRSARLEAAAAIKYSRDMQELAAETVAAANTKLVRAAAAERRAAALSREAAAARAALDAAIAAAPPECAPVVLAAKSVTDRQEASSAELAKALADAKVAAAAYRKSYETTHLALVRAEGAIARLTVTSRALEQASAPSLFSRLAPRPGVGVAVGVDALGVPRVTVGFTLGWSL